VNKRFITYAEAIREGTQQALRISKDVMVMGQLINKQHGVFGTTSNLYKEFGKQRIREFPVSESLMTSAALGAAIDGKRVILVHIRLDFMLYSMDAIVNWLSLWRFKSFGKSGVSVVIRAIVGKGWGNGPQHSKSLHSWFANLPGIRVVLPTNAFDAKGFLIESIFSDDPTIIIEHRSFFNLKDYVPIQPYRINFGKSNILVKGKHISIVAIGYGVLASMQAAEFLKKDNIFVEVIDMRCLYPLDMKTILKSVKKTRKLLVVDPSWKSFGASSEIITSVLENFNNKTNIKYSRVTYPDSHIPVSESLEKKYFFDYKEIVSKVRSML
jgi:acetoin:2,6-dichlorophenolindophenol oxidoreductase subunit beta